MADVQLLIGGEAGYGIMTTGAMMGKIFTRLGLSVFDYVEYPSLIRGGHNAFYVRASDTQIYSQKKPVDILIALNRDTIDKHKQELAHDSAIIFDPAIVKVDASEFPTTVLQIQIPLLEITKQVGADRLMINTVSIGASLALFHGNFDVLHGILRDSFGRKGEKVVEENVKTTRAGFNYIQEHYPKKFHTEFVQQEQKSLFLTGSEAVAIAAIRAGVKFAAIYPMTPINSIMSVLTAYALQYNIIVKEPEDEIAGINMAIGASYAGVRSIAATSGGGFALMTESVGLAAQTETPLVVIEGMRPGPATGMPTWTDQGDLRFVLHAAQGDFPRIVLAPSDAQEAFTMTLLAFNLADKYQIPVMILGDKYLFESHMSVDSAKFKVQNETFKIDRGKLLTDKEIEKLEEYKRYLLTDDGVSPRTIPGQKGGIALSGSDEHDERGLYNEVAENRSNMVEKRFKKLEKIRREVPTCTLFGKKDARLTLVGFGSTKMPVLEAIQWLQNEGITTNFLQVQTLAPFPSDEVIAELRRTKKTMILEENFSGQFEGLMKEQTGISFKNHFRKYDGRPFYPEEIVEHVKAMLEK